MSRDEEKVFLPFFSKPSGLSIVQDHSSNKRVSEDHPHFHDDAPEPSVSSLGMGSTVDKPMTPKRVPRPNESSRASKGKTQKTLQDLLNPRGNMSTQLEEVGKEKIKALAPSDMDLALSHQQCRRTDANDLIQGSVNGIAPPQIQPRRPASPQVMIPSSSVSPGRVPPTNSETSKTPPKKLLKLNASGKLSSPVLKHKHEIEQVAEDVKRRKKPHRIKQDIIKKQLKVTLNYGKDEVTRAELGGRIERILAGEEKLATPKTRRTSRKPAKSMHPFFTVKPKEEPIPHNPKPRRKASAVTPGKLKMQTYREYPQEVKEVTFAVGSALLKDRLMLKHAGAKEAPWPSGCHVHVRRLSDEYKVLPRAGHLYQPARKGKAAKPSLQPEESILKHFFSHIAPEADCKLRPDGFREPHPSLRPPERKLLFGGEIARRISKELSVTFYSILEDDLTMPKSPHLAAHLSLQNLWRRLPNALTAFDECRGETLGWAQKYAPSSAAEVLQPDRETAVLKEWLSSLAVNAVEHMTKSAHKRMTKLEPKPKKRPKRKGDDMDNFLVDSDEEVNDMNEIVGSDEMVTQGSLKIHKSVVQIPSEGKKLNNAVLLSGPHGCGKTAAAYAIAKELGFKVFEIGPNERRNGKDVLDKVGDMTENHLVKHHGSDLDVSELSSNENPSQLDEEFQRDLVTGRQGKMNSFFKPQAKTAKQQIIPKEIAKARITKAVQDAIKKPIKDQQQSLILLEEVDILFKDDKDFWTTVLRLIATSKRPFIMTCNDEDLVPSQAMSLHAILRFSPPPLDLAIDYMLLIAASEGHILKRDAVCSLYKSANRDLRASIMKLDFWCQMGVGDPRGGLSWIYQRYPPGADIDANGRRLRVASDGTYQHGMGSAPEHGLDNLTSMLWVWSEYDVDPSNLLGWDQMTSGDWLDESLGAATPEQRYRALKSFESFSHAMSNMDTFVSRGLPNSAALDTTQPPISDKACTHYIEGLRLLQADEPVDHLQFSAQLGIETTLLAHHTAGLGGKVNTALTPSVFQSKIKSKPTADDVTNLTRRDFACFDAISVPSDNVLSTSIALIQSAFDGPLSSIVTDLAPYVRTIAQFDLALEEHRERLSNLTSDSDGVRKAKRARTTRAARSALEGGQRATTRRERWFTKALDLRSVLATGITEWP